MLKLQRVPCIWCHRPVSAVFRGFAWVAECEHCHDTFEVQGISVSEGFTEINRVGEVCDG